MAAGTLSLTANAKGLSANITALASITTTMSVKWCQKVDGLNALGANSKAAVFSIDSDGAGTTGKLTCGWTTDGAGNIKLSLGLPGQGSANGPNGVALTLPANGNYIICCVDIEAGSSAQHIAVFQSNGTIIAGLSGAAALNSGGTIAGTGRVTWNKDTTNFFSQTAQVYGGAAMYSSQLLTTARTSAPTAGDANIVGMWSMNDAASGTTPSTAAAQVGAQGLVLSGTYAWAGDSSPWAPAQVPTTATISPLTPTILGGATQQFTGTILDAGSSPIVGEPVTWASSNTMTATVNATGLATSVFPGTSTITVADVANPAVSANTVLTVQTLATLGLSSVGKGLSPNVAGLAALQTTFSVKWCQKVDSLRTLGAALSATSSAVAFLDQDGANTNHKLALGWSVSAAGKLNLSFHVYTVGDFFGPAGIYTDLPANGNYIICEVDCVNNVQHFNVYTVAGTAIASMTGTQARAMAGLPTTGGVNGMCTLNKDNSASLYTQQASVYAGMAWYNSVLSGTAVYTAPAATDAGIVAGWYMADAASLSAVTSASAFVGGQALALTGQTWDNDSNPWAPSLAQVPTSATITPTGATLAPTQTQQLTGTILDGSSNPIVGAAVTWASSSTGVATISGTGLVTAVAAGQTTITLASSVVPSVTTTATVTVTGIGTLSFTSSGSGLSGNVPLVATIQTAMSVKWCQKVDQLAALGASLRVPVLSIDQDGAGTNAKVRIGWGTDGSGNIGLQVSVPGQGGGIGPLVAQASLPASGSYIICEVNLTGTAQNFNVYTSALSKITGLSGATSTNLGSNWGIVPGANGRVTVNKDPSGYFSNQSALVYGGMAIYTSILTGTAVYTVPAATDTGLAAGWYMNDATSTSSPSTAAAFAGGQVLVLTNNTWLSNASAWASAQVPTSATVAPATLSLTTLQTGQLTGTIFDASGLPITGEPVNWSSNNPGVAVVNTTGGVTPISAGTATITVADAAAPAVSATSVITVTTGLATSATLTCTPYSTAGSGSPIAGLIATWSTSNAAVATVDATGLVTGQAAGTATITGAISGHTDTCTVTVT